MGSSHLQRSMGGGIASTSLIPRADTAKVQASVRDMLNFWATRSGSAQNRPGFRYVATTKDQHDDLRIERFAFNDEQAYSIEVGERYFRFYQFAEGDEFSDSVVVSDESPPDVDHDFTETFYISDEDDGVDLTPPFAAQPEANFTNTGTFARRYISGIPTTQGLLTGGTGVNRTFWVLPINYPGSAGDWEMEESTLVIEVVVAVSGSGFTGALANVSRVSSDLSTIVSTSSSSAGQAIAAAFTGTLTFTIPASTLAGTDADDRLVVQLVAQGVGGGDNDAMEWSANEGLSYFTTSIETDLVSDSIPYVDGVGNVVGDVVFVDAVVSPVKTWFGSDVVTSPTPSGFGGTVSTTDPYATVDDSGATAGSITATAGSGQTRKQILVTEAGSPGLTQWPNASMLLSLQYTDINSSTNAFSVTARPVRVNSSNVLIEGGSTSSPNGDLEAADGSEPVTFTFLLDPPAAGWAAGSATDRLAIELSYTAGVGVSRTAVLALGSDTETFVTTPAAFDPLGGLDYFYAVADSINKHPSITEYHDDFWYPLPEDADGNALLEVPTPYLQADLADLQFVQAGDIVTITHRDYTPHELIRSEHPTMTFGRWTMLPIAYKPSQSAPTTFVSVDGGVAGAKRLQYKITAINSDTGKESNPAPGGTSAAGGAGSFSAVVANKVLSNTESTALDLSVASVAHGLLTGDEVYIVTVETTDTDRAHQGAIELLQDTVQVIDRTSADAFTLRGTAGLLIDPILLGDDAYPSLQIDYTHAYVQYTTAKPPKAQANQRIEFSWTAASGAGFYNIYRRIKDESALDNEGTEPWGFLDSTTGTSFADVGEDINGVVVVAEVDEETLPPDYKNPFVFGMWPRSSAYHKQRQWFAGFNDRPRQAWGSRIGDFRNFSLRTTLRDDDPVQFDIASEEANEIRHLSSLGRLTIFTSGVVWVVNGDSNGDITPTSIGLESMTYEGATGVRAEGADDSLLYVQARGSTIREIRYNLENGGLSGYQGRDLTVYAPRLFDGYQFKDIAVTRIPHSIVWVVRDDGTLLGLTYIVEHEVWAWHRHDTLNGAILSVATIPEENVDALYAVVRRDIDGTDTYFVERMDVRTIGRANIDTRVESFFVDGGITYNGANTGVTTLTLSGGTTWETGETGLTLTASADLFDSGDPAAGVGWRLVGADGEEVEVDVTAYSSATVVTVTLLTDAPASTQATATADWVKMLEDITGLDHLEGEDVVALADNNVIEDLTVSSGTVVLARPYGVVHVGLPITADIEMLDLDLAQDVDTISDKQKRVAKATLFLEDTRGIQVGIDGTGLQEMQLEHGDEALDLITGKRTIRFPTTYNNEGRVLIRQENPLPAEITAIVRHVEIGDV